MQTAPGESYTIRMKVFKIFGNAFHIYGPDGELVGFCKQKAFKLREDIRFYTDESLSTELFAMSARQIIDFGATYDIALPTGESLGSLRQKGLKSLFKDEWLVFGPDGSEIAKVTEDSTAAALIRRIIPFAAALSPQRLHMIASDGRHIATYRTHFNPFIYRLGVTVHEDSEQLDDLMILAAGCLFAAVEGRQQSR